MSLDFKTDVKPEDVQDIKKIKHPIIEDTEELAFNIEDFISEKQYQRFLKETVRIKLNASILEARNENYNNDERILLSKLKASYGENFNELPVSRKDFYWLEEKGFAERIDLDLEKLTNKVFNRENLVEKSDLSTLDNKFFYLEYMDIIKRMKITDNQRNELIAKLNSYVTKRLNRISIFAVSTLTDDKSIAKIKTKLSYEEQALFDTLVELTKTYKLYIRKKILNIDSGEIVN